MTLKASEEGGERIKQARSERGCTIAEPWWLVEASQELERDRTWTELGPYARGRWLPTWRRWRSSLSDRYPEWVEETRLKVAAELAQLERGEGIDGEIVIELDCQKNFAKCGKINKEPLHYLRWSESRSQCNYRWLCNNKYRRASIDRT